MSPDWSPFDHLPDLPPGRVVVVRVALDLDSEPGFETLSPAERAQARRYAFAADRRRYAATRQALRVWLGGFRGEEPGAVPLMEEPAGRPIVPDRRPHFNVSHAGPWALLAFAGDRPVGVDVEPIRYLDDWPQLVALTFTELELAEAADGLTPDDFFRVWTRKEAVLKASGKGLGIEPARVTVGLGLVPAGGIWLEGLPYHLHDLVVAPGVCGAVAIQRGEIAEMFCMDGLPPASL